MVVHCCIVKFTSFHRDGRPCNEYLFACVKRNKIDSELLLKFIEYFPDCLSALSRTLLRIFGQPLSKQLYMLFASVDQCSLYACTYSVLRYGPTDRLEVDLCKEPSVLLLILHGFRPSMYK